MYRLDSNNIKNIDNLAEPSTAFVRDGHSKEGVEGFKRWLKSEGVPDDHASWLADLTLPIIAESKNELKYARNRYQVALHQLESSWTPHFLRLQHFFTASLFYLAYHGEPNRELMLSHCRLHRQHFGTLEYTADHVREWRFNRDRKLRIGFCSTFLHDKHTIGKLYSGLIKQLNRQRFDVTVFHPATSAPEEARKRIDSLCSKAISLTGSLESHWDAIANEQLDVLFYPDIGMHRDTYLMTFARLAPIQVVSWGHPETTGVDTLDYFLSSSLIETVDSSDEYSEKLVCFDHLPAYYPRPLVPAKPFNRAAFGLPENKTLYGCPQTLFKIHPDFDPILAQIAEGDPNGALVFLEGRNPEWVHHLKARWAKTFPVLLDHVIFLKPCSKDRFLMLLSHIDVLLDPIHFGSGNTMYEAMAYGTPIVTWPGRFMRGRVVAGAYQQMGVDDAPIAQKIEDYAPLALALGKDERRCKYLKRNLRKAANKFLFSDKKFVRDFEEFIESALLRADCRQPV